MEQNFKTPGITCAFLSILKHPVLLVPSSLFQWLTLGIKFVWLG